MDREFDQDPNAPDALDTVNAAMALIEGEFLQSAERDLAILREAIAALATRAAPREAEIARIGHLAHDLRGQSGAFGYMALGEFAGSLHEYARQGAPGDAALVAQAHCEALAEALSARRKGPLGRAEEETLSALHHLTGVPKTAI